MNLNEYQKQAMTTALYKDEMYPVVGLAEEVGEVSRLYAKVLRGDVNYVEHTMSGDPILTEFFHKNIKKELGDVLWMVSAIAHENNLKLTDIAELNLSKLSDRQIDGTLKGDGDDR